MIVHSLTFNNSAGAFSLTGSSFNNQVGVEINQSSSSAISIANGFVIPNNSGSNNTHTITLDGDGTGVLTLSGTFGDGNGSRKTAISKSGNSVFLLSGGGGYSGGTTITGGTLRISNASALGTGAVTVGGVGAGTLDLSNVALIATNLTLNNGAMLLGSGGANSSYSNSGSPSIGNGAAVTFATATSSDVLTISTFIETGNASSSITVSGPGTTVISSGSAGAAAYAGSWNLDGSSTTVLRLSNANALGNPNGTGGRPITLTAGTLQLRVTTGSTFTTSTTVAGNVAITPDAGTSGSSSNTHALGNLTVNDGVLGVNTLTLTVNQGTNYSANATGSLIFGPTTLNDNISFALNNTHGSGVGAVTLGALNDTGAAKTISTGGGGALTLGTAASSLVDGTAVNITGGTVNSNVNNALGSLANVTLSTDATFNVGASQTIGALNSAVSNTGNVTLGSNVLTIGNSNNNLSGSFAGVISGTGGIIKAGSGVQILSGSNTYAGLTDIQNGKVTLKNTGNIAGSIHVSSGTTFDVTDFNGGGGFTIAANQTLSGKGTVSGKVNINTGATISPGDSPGVITADAMDFGNTGHYLWEVNDASDTTGLQAGIIFDKIHVTGVLNISADSGNKFNIDITSPNGGTTDIANFDKTHNYDWVIATADGGVTNFHMNQDQFMLNDFVSNDTTGVNGAPDGVWSILLGNSNTDLILHYSAAPEPGSMTLLAIGIGGWLGRRPRRQPVSA